MKVENINNQFKPIEIKITIDSQNELKWLWHLFNLAHEDISTEYKTKYHKRMDFPIESQIPLESWNYIDNLCKKRGLRK